jgi:hypothetical protein
MINETDIILIVCLLFIIMGLPIAYKYASFMIGKSGLVIAHSFIATMISLAFAAVGMIIWIFYSWGINEFLFVGGMILGAGTSFFSIVVLILLLIFKRKKMLNRYISG